MWLDVMEIKQACGGGGEEWGWGGHPGCVIYLGAWNFTSLSLNSWFTGMTYLPQGMFLDYYIMTPTAGHVVSTLHS